MATLSQTNLLLMANYCIIELRRAVCAKLKLILGVNLILIDKGCRYQQLTRLLWGWAGAVVMAIGYKGKKYLTLLVMFRSCRPLDYQNAG